MTRNKFIITNWSYSVRELLSLNKECWKYVLSRWWRCMVYVLSLIATVMTILNQSVDMNQIIILLLCSILISLIMSLPRNYVSYCIEGLNGTKIDLIIGNMFDENCDMVIPTNTCFDVDWGSISSQSVQGQFCKKFYQGNTDLLNNDIEKLLHTLNCPTEYLASKEIGKKIQYPINTIITLQLGQQADDQRFHWIAINHSDDKSHVVRESVCLHKSIDTLWNHLGRYCKIRDLCLPILGTRYATKNLPLPDVVEYYIDSFIIHSKNNNLVRTLKIYLYPASDNVFEYYNVINNYLRYRAKSSMNIENKYIV